MQGAAFLILYLIGLGAFSATRATALFWPGVFDPVGVILNDSITRYWTVVEKNTLLYSWSLHAAGGVFFYNRLLWGSASACSAWACFGSSSRCRSRRSPREPAVGALART